MAMMTTAFVAFFIISLSHAIDIRNPDFDGGEFWNTTGSSVTFCNTSICSFYPKKSNGWLRIGGSSIVYQSFQLTNPQISLWIRCHYNNDSQDSLSINSFASVYVLNMVACNNIGALSDWAQIFFYLGQGNISFISNSYNGSFFEIDTIETFTSTTGNNFPITSNALTTSIAEDSTDTKTGISPSLRTIIVVTTIVSALLIVLILFLGIRLKIEHKKYKQDQVLRQLERKKRQEEEDLEYAVQLQTREMAKAKSPPVLSPQPSSRSSFWKSLFGRGSTEEPVYVNQSYLNPENPYSAEMKRKSNPYSAELRISNENPYSAEIKPENPYSAELKL